MYEASLWSICFCLCLKLTVYVYLFKGKASHSAVLQSSSVIKQRWNWTLRKGWGKSKTEACVIDISCCQGGLSCNERLPQKGPKYRMTWVLLVQISVWALALMSAECRMVLQSIPVYTHISQSITICPKFWLFSWSNISPCRAGSIYGNPGLSHNGTISPPYSRWQYAVLIGLP